MRDIKVETWVLSKLKPYAKNARTHSEQQIKQIAASITEFGWTYPLLIDGEGNVIAGHARLQAAKQLGMTEAPAIRLDHLTPTQRRAYIIADNKLAENAGWDMPTLGLEVGELGALGFPLPLLGFDAGELAGFAARLNPVDPDDAPEVPVNPVTRAGDLWVLGDHRLLCGDATKAEDVHWLLAGASPHLMVTDPPYGIEYDADWRNHALRSNGSPIAGRAIGRVTNDDRSDWRAAWALFPGDVAYVWHAGRHASVVQASLEVCEFTLRWQIIWAKTRFVIGRGDYHGQHEPCWYAVRKGAAGRWQGARDQTTLWSIEHRKSETGHSTQKPVECMKRPIENNSAPGDAVYEPFSGSGTTIIAAEMTARRCYALEIAPEYIDVAVMRWQNFTGKQATLDGDGRSFDELSAVRKAA